MIEIPDNQRSYIRHPVTFPIHVTENEVVFQDAHRMQNISYGGLAFVTSRCYAPEQVIQIEIPSPHLDFITPCVVKWCTPRVDGAFVVGVEFLEPDQESQVRMVEQICHIETYRKIVEESEGRELSELDAAREWIAKFASTFQQPSDYRERLSRDQVNSNQQKQE